MRINRLGGLAAIAYMCLALAACEQSGPDPRGPDENGDAAATQTSTNQAAVDAAREAARDKAEAAERIERAKAQATERAERARSERLFRIEGVRRRDTSLNWVDVGVSTGKFDEEVNTTVHRTYAECARASSMEARSCFPIPKLPESYWKAGG